MCNSVGSWSLDIVTGEARDGGKTSFFEGSTKSAMRHVEGFGVTNISSKNGGCIVAAREFDLGLLPLTFIHSANAELETRNFILEYITRKEIDARVDEISRSHFGKVKKQKRLRFYKEYTNAAGRSLLELNCVFQRREAILTVLQSCGFAS